MKRQWLILLGMFLLCSVPSTRAADYRVELLKSPAPADDLPPEIASQLAPTGFKVLQGEKRTLCEIWPSKSWAVNAGFQPSDSVLYPLNVGEFIGVLRFPRKGADFRGQDIASGLYTLRYGNQPVDGNHAGTSPTRDFLLVLPASADPSPKPLTDKEMFKISAQSAESSHPAILSLVKAEADGDLPSMRHLEEHDQWTVRFAGNGAASKVILELIVVGRAAE
jgi:hypothetical protein